MIRGICAATFVATALIFAACGDDDAPPKPGETPAATASPQAPPPPPAPNAPPSATSSDPQGAQDPEKECLARSYCESRCERECFLEERNRKSYFDAKRAKIPTSPFTTKVERVFLSGSCAKGDTPEKRKSTSGIKAVIEGTITYNGDDMLYQAELGGEAYLRFGADRYAEAPTVEKTYGRWYSRPKKVTRFPREVRGADPWFKGETRAFHWESRPLSEAFCEVTPDEATAYVELTTMGVKTGRDSHPLSFVKLNWDEVVGMAVRKQINVLRKQGKEYVEEPADAIYAKLDKILATRLTGNTEWLKRTSTTQSGDLPRGAASSFPQSASSEEWKVQVTGISQVKEFGGYSHKGEDQFLALVDIGVTFTGEGDASMKGFSARLETSPGKWQKVASKAVGQLDSSETVTSGSSTSGKLAFPCQRFERPFRLEVTMPDKNKFYLDVFDYGLGPARAE